MASFALLEIINGFRKLLCPRDKWYLLGLVILLCIGAAMEIAGLGLLLPLVAAFTKPELLEQNTLLCFSGSFSAGQMKNNFCSSAAAV